MINLFRKVVYLSTFILLLLSSQSSSFAQATLSSDELFTLARKEAFDNKNYAKAIELSKSALAKSPDYHEIRAFLGRIYTWSDKTDSARFEFKKVLEKEQNHEEALNGIFDLEYWNKNYSKALDYAESGVRSHPQSESFTIRKAKALNALGRPVEALKAIKTFKAHHPKTEAIEEIETSIKQANANNKVGLGYTFVDNERFGEPWHLANMSYGRAIKGIGTITVGINYANRFNTNGTEFEAESYPSIMPGLYAYVGGAVSEGGLFPNYRLGFSLYKSLPGSFEIEAGVRHLQFNSPTTLYVAGLGRYFGNSLIGLKSYLTPSEGSLSKSFNLSAKFFFTEDRNDYFNATIGTGISPDDKARRIDIIRNLKSFKVSADYSRNIGRNFTAAAGAGWVREEYLTKTFGNQFSFNISTQVRF